MPYKDPKKRLAAQNKWRKNNPEKVLKHYLKQKSKKRIKFAKGVDKAHCLICGKEFIKTSVRHKYCTLKCTDKRNNIYSSKGRPKKYQTEEDRKKAHKILHKKYRDSEKGKLTQKKYMELESTQIRLSKYRSSNEYKIMTAKNESKFRKTEKGKEIKKRYFKKRYKVDFNFRLRQAMRSRLHDFLKKRGMKKPNTSNKLLGCSWNELTIHIEKQFLPGMTWENRSNKTWHIDHIIPLSKATNEQDLIRLCHFTNLQPLWAVDNIKKGNKL